MSWVHHRIITPSRISAKKDLNFKGELHNYRQNWGLSWQLLKILNSKGKNEMNFMFQRKSKNGWVNHVVSKNATYKNWKWTRWFIFLKWVLRSLEIFKISNSSAETLKPKTIIHWLFCWLRFTSSGFICIDTTEALPTVLWGLVPSELVLGIFII